jgi:hypothetical protein
VSASSLSTCDYTVQKAASIVTKDTPFVGHLPTFPSHHSFPPSLQNQIIVTSLHIGLTFPFSPGKPHSPFFWIILQRAGNMLFLTLIFLFFLRYFLSFQLFFFGFLLKAHQKNTNAVENKTKPNKHSKGEK